MPLRSCFSIRLIFILLILASVNVAAQDRPVYNTSDSIPKSATDSINAAKIKKTADSLNAVKKKSDTTAKKKKGDAGKAALRSAIIPGWGQAYNKKYWKMPIVYGALTIPVLTYRYNREWYLKTKEAYSIRYYNDTSTVSDLPTDGIDQELQPLSTNSLQQYRNSFRQGMDFSILAFVAIWGLQIVDAAVDGHLKSFNINDDLSLKISPYVSPGKSKGVSMVFMLRDDKPKTVLPAF